MAKPTTVVELSVWDNPPSCKRPLLLTLLILFICGAIFTGVGVSILNEPDKPIKGLLQKGHEKKDVPACRQGNLNLCPTIGELTSADVDRMIWGREIYADIPIFITVCGVIQMVIAVVHTGLVVKRAKRLMFLICLFIIISVTITWKVVDVCVYTGGSLHSHVEQKIRLNYFLHYTILVNKTSEAYNNVDTIDLTSRLFNTISIAVGCCGLRKLEDAKLTHHGNRNNITVNGETYNYTFPPVCCESGDVKTLATSVSSHGCKHGTGKDAVNTTLKTKVCYDAVFDYVYDNTGKWLVALSIVAVCTQSLQLTFTVFFLLSRSTDKIQDLKGAESVSRVSGATSKNEMTQE